jgi:hypothetical protein
MSLQPKEDRKMNTTKLMLCAIGATLITSATALGALAKPVDDMSATGTSVSKILSSQPQLIGTRPAAENRSSASAAQIALNPQPLPPGIVDDDHDW